MELQECPSLVKLNTGSLLINMLILKAFITVCLPYSEPLQVKVEMDLCLTVLAMSAVGQVGNVVIQYML